MVTGQDLRAPPAAGIRGPRGARAGSRPERSLRRKDAYADRLHEAGAFSQALDTRYELFGSWAYLASVGAPERWRTRRAVAAARRTAEAIVAQARALGLLERRLIPVLSWVHDQEQRGEKGS